MYNKCDKCGKMIDNYEGRKLVLDNQGKVTTRCMACYENALKIKKIP